MKLQKVNNEMKRIIIVEVEFIIALALKKVVEAMGHHVTAIVDNGEEAISLVTEGSVELILIDVRLSGEMDGIETIKQIRTFSDVPVIYITSNSTENMQKQALQTDPAGYLFKPVQTDVLRQTIHKVLDARQTYLRNTVKIEDFRQTCLKSSSAHLAT